MYSIDAGPAPPWLYFGDRTVSGAGLNTSSAFIAAAPGRGGCIPARSAAKTGSPDHARARLASQAGALPGNLPELPLRAILLGSIKSIGLSMPTIRIKENEPFDVALRRFKRTIEKAGIITELRAREFYEKPTAERKRKKAAAVKRHFKRIRSQMLPKKLY